MALAGRFRDAVSPAWEILAISNRRFLNTMFEAPGFGISGPLLNVCSAWMLLENKEDVATRQSPGRDLTSRAALIDSILQPASHPLVRLDSFADTLDCKP